MNINHTWTGKKHIVEIYYSDDQKCPNKWRHRIESEDIEIVKICLKILYDKTKW